MNKHMCSVFTFINLSRYICTCINGCFFKLGGVFLWVYSSHKPCYWGLVACTYEYTGKLCQFSVYPYSGTTSQISTGARGKECFASTEGLAGFGCPSQVCSGCLVPLDADVCRRFPKDRTTQARNTQPKPQ